MIQDGCHEKQYTVRQQFERSGVGVFSLVSRIDGSCLSREAKDFCYTKHDTSNRLA
jgi:hypothetical protein